MKCPHCGKPIEEEEEDNKESKIKKLMKFIMEEDDSE